MFKVQRFILILTLSLAATVWALGQSTGQAIPPPLRIYVPFTAVWNTAVETLENNNLRLLNQNRGQGLIRTRFREYISGSLTEDHLDKIGEAPRLIDGEWVRVNYQYEILIEFIQQKETVITVDANIEALERNFLGNEKRVSIPSNGSLEEKLLINFGQSLFGQNFNLQKPKKGYWERDPVYLPLPTNQFPSIAGPERTN